MTFIKMIFTISFVFSFYTSVYANSEDLFSDTIPLYAIQAEDTNNHTDTTMLRSKKVNINFSLLPQQLSETNTTIFLNLFDDVKYPFMITKIEHSSLSNTTTWSGNIKGDKGSSVVISVTNNVAIGSIHTGTNKIYNIEYIQNHMHQIEEVNTSVQPPMLDPIIPQETEEDSLNHLYRSLPTEGKSADAANVFNIMYVYTTAARKTVGGTNAMQSLINSMVSYINTSFSNSHMNIRVHLVQTIEVAYPTDYPGLNSKKKFLKSLERFKGKHEGYMDNIHTIRNQYKADLVQLLVANKGGLGRGYIMSKPSHHFESSAFSIVSISYKSFYSRVASVHEFGHNMGVSHDRITDHNHNKGSFAYSHGYLNANGGHGKGFSTIMAYSQNCPIAKQCPRINYWSTPTLTYYHTPIGIPKGNSQAADAKRTILNNANIVANFRSGAHPSKTTWVTGRYHNNEDRNKTLYISGAQKLKVKIKGHTERGYDYVYIYNAHGQLIKMLDGNINKTFILTGSSIKARLKTDYSVVASGVTVSITKIK